MPTTDLRKAGQEVVGRHDETTFALDGLDDGRRYARRVDHGGELPLDGFQGLPANFLRMRAPVGVRERHPVHLRRERPEPPLVRLVPAGKCHREQRPAVERAVEADDGRPPGERPRELDRVLHRFGARVEERHLAVPAAAQPHQALRQLHVGLVRDHREVGVREPLRLPPDGLHHPGVRVADQLAPQAAREVQHGVAVHVGEGGTRRAIDHDRRMQVERIGHHSFLTGQDLAGPGARDLGGQIDGGHDDSSCASQCGREQASRGY